MSQRAASKDRRLIDVRAAEVADGGDDQEAEVQAATTPSMHVEDEIDQIFFRMDRERNARTNKIRETVFQQGIGGEGKEVSIFGQLVAERASPILPYQEQLQLQQQRQPHLNNQRSMLAKRANESSNPVAHRAANRVELDKSIWVAENDNAKLASLYSCANSFTNLIDKLE